MTATGVEEIGVDAIAVGDTLLVRKGETAPADGVLEDEAATLDDSALTGESLPINLVRGGKLRSGAVNAGSAFRMRAEHTAEASSYAAIIRLTRAAAETRPPLARLADQWALGFVAHERGGGGQRSDAAADKIGARVRGMRVGHGGHPCRMRTTVAVQGAGGGHAYSVIRKRGSRFRLC